MCFCLKNRTFCEYAFILPFQPPDVGGFVIVKECLKRYNITKITRNNTMEEEYAGDNNK